MEFDKLYDELMVDVTPEAEVEVEVEVEVEEPSGGESQPEGQEAE